LRGLLAVAPDGSVRVLADQVDGTPLRFADAVVVAGDGKIYVSDASSRFSPAQGGTMEAAMLDVLEQSSTGRIIEYDPAKRAGRVVASGISFANGVALADDGVHLYVCETGRYRVWKIARAAQQLDVRQPSPQAQVLLDNLPGYPDNLQRAPDGRTWLGLAGPRNDLDAMAQRPFLRKLMLRVPRALWPMPKPFGHVLAFTDDGRIVDDLQDGSGSSPTTTGATLGPHGLYIHNIDGDSLGWLPR
jgi:sugar lactone lactonase YvrE